MPDEHEGKQRWREVPPLPDDERWTLESEKSDPPGIGPPPPLPTLPPLSDSRRPSAAAARGRETLRKPDQLPNDALRRQAKPVAGNTVLAAILAIGTIALIVLVTMFLAKK